MTWNYAYTLSIWSSVFTAVFMLVLSFYGWRRRSVPGALPFMIGCLFGAALAASTGMEYTAVDLETKIFWAKFEAACRMPVIIAVTCFILEYAWLGRRRGLWRSAGIRLRRGAVALAGEPGSTRPSAPNRLRLVGHRSRVRLFA